MTRMDEVPEDVEETNELGDLDDDEEDDFDGQSEEEEMEDEDESLDGESGVNGQRLNGTHRYHGDEEAKEAPARRNYHDVDMSESQDEIKLSQPQGRLRSGGRRRQAIISQEDS